jgi:hypothetical protein
MGVPAVNEPQSNRGAPPDESGAVGQVQPDGQDEVPITARSLKALTMLSLKRTFDMFVANYGQNILLDEGAKQSKAACKVCEEYLGNISARTLPHSTPSTADV